LELFIKDDGVRFNPEQGIVERNRGRGLGLLSIKERTELFGGLFGIESTKRKGTTVRASWLLSRKN